jgi:hypothetical protein
MREIISILMRPSDRPRRLPEFKTYVQEQGLVDLWRASDNWGDYCRPLPGNDDFECF